LAVKCEPKHFNAVIYALAAKAVNNLNHIGEGAFIMKTAPAVGVFWLVATAGVTAIFILKDLL
jgi:hypothetical protein